MPEGNKSSFVLYADMAQHIALLTDEQAGQLFKGLFSFCADGDTPTFADGITTMAFSFIAAQIDRDSQKYNETCAKRSAAGKKGGRPRKANALEQKQTKAKKANGFFEKQTKAKKADNDTDNDNVTDTDILSGFSAELRTVFDDWIVYKKEKRKGYKPTGLQRLATKVRDMVTVYGDRAVVQVMQDAMANGYDGIVWDKIQDKPKPQQLCLSQRQAERGDEPL